MKFSRRADGNYQATRKDGQVISIEKLHHDKDEDTLYRGWWAVRYEGDDHGDNTAYAKTKRELVAMENRIELSL